MNRKSVFLILTPLIILVLAACGGGQPAEPAEPEIIEEEIVVDMQDIYFGSSSDNIENPAEWTVSSGAEVTVRMDNMGALEHSWVVLEAGSEIPVNFDEAQDGDKVYFNSGIVPAEATEAVTFTAPAPGTYNVLCTIPGHSIVMQGRLIVSG